VAKVEISADGGQSWREAELARHPAARWCWTFWSTTVNLDRGMYELAVRAWDAAGRTQPALPAEVWNFKGYLCTAWHRIGVHAT
jgi:sulfite oxidase